MIADDVNSRRNIIVTVLRCPGQTVAEKASDDPVDPVCDFLGHVKDAIASAQTLAPLMCTRHSFATGVSEIML